MNILIDKNKFIYFLVVSLLIGIFSALNWKIALFISIAYILFIIYLAIPYKLQVIGIILLYPYTDFINEKISVFKIGLSLYITILLFKAINERRSKLLFNNKISKAYIIFIIVCIFSIIFAPNKAGALEEVIRLTSIGLMCAIIYCYIESKQDILKIYSFFLISSIIPIIIGFIQSIFNLGMIYGDDKRVISTFSHPSNSGFYFAFLSINFLILIISKRNRLLFKNKKSIYVLFFMAIISLYGTSTRSAWINFAIGVILTVILYYKELIIYCIYIGGPAILLVYNKIKSRFVGEISSTGALVVNVFGISVTGSYASRIYFWIYSIEHMFLKNILFGTGIGSFFYTYSGIMHEQLIGRAEYVEMHNDFIKLLAETGIVGIVTYIIFLLLTLINFIRTEKVIIDKDVKIILRIITIIFIMACILHFTDALFRILSVEWALAILLGIGIKIIDLNKRGECV